MWCVIPVLSTFGSISRLLISVHYQHHQIQRNSLQVCGFILFLLKLLMQSIEDVLTIFPRPIQLHEQQINHTCSLKQSCFVNVHACYYYQGRAICMLSLNARSWFNRLGKSDTLSFNLGCKHLILGSGFCHISLIWLSLLLKRWRNGSHYINKMDQMLRPRWPLSSSSLYNVLWFSSNRKEFLENLGCAEISSSLSHSQPLHITHTFHWTI